MKSTFLFITLLSLPALAQTWKPYHELGDFYPSFAIAVSTFNPADTTRDEYTFGDSKGLMGIIITPARANTTVRLDLRSGGDVSLFEPVVLEATLPQVGEEYLITPRITYSPAQLAALRQAVTTTITYSLTINGKAQTSRTEILPVHAINDCPFSVVDSTDTETPIDYVFAAYVNEDHPYVDAILQEALRKKYVDTFTGDVGSETDVYRQVAAVWRVLQERGIRYSNSPVVQPVPNGVVSQYVRLLDESIQTAQVNCVDGSVLLASVLRRIGINPILVVVPGHMFVGFDMSPDGSHQAYLETTLLGADARTANVADSPLYKILLANRTDTPTQVVLKSFVAAMNAGDDLFTQHESQMQNLRPGYAFVNIGDARDAGIVPIQYVGSGIPSR